MSSPWRFIRHRIQSMLWDPTVRLSLFTWHFLKFVLLPRSKASGYGWALRALTDDLGGCLALWGHSLLHGNSHSLQRMTVARKKTNPRGRVLKGMRQGMGEGREVSEEKVQLHSEPCSTLCPPGTAARGIHGCPKDSPLGHRSHETNYPETAAFYSLINCFHQKRKT